MIEKKCCNCVTIGAKHFNEYLLDIVYTDAGDDFLTVTMPVNPRVHQPMGLLHGGATVALAESVESAASLMFVNPEKKNKRFVVLKFRRII